MQKDEMRILERLKNDIVTFDHDDIVRATKDALDAGFTPEKIISEALVPGMEEVGKRYEKDEYFLPDLIMASEAMTEAVKTLFKPAARDKENPVVVLATVKGDIHDIGKNLLGNYLGGLGIRTYDLGVDAAVDDVVEAVALLRPKVLALSSMLSNTRGGVSKIIRALEKRGLRDSLKIIIGGSSAGRHYALRSGADAYAADAVKGSVIIKRWI